MPNLDFSGQNTLYATHGLHAYAAKCPPQLVRYSLRHYSKPGERVLDPMAGSGTALVESCLYGRNAVGYDIDPLARLIAQVKTRPLADAKLEQATTLLINRAERDLNKLSSTQVSQALRQRATPPDFPNRDYWFEPSVAKALAILRAHISELDTQPSVRNFLWVAFSSLILNKHSVANARDIIHSRHHFYPHITPPNVLERFKQRLTKMRQQMAEFQDACKQFPDTKAEARLGDARMLRLADESIDMVFTSPPYVTALDYPRAHFLAIAWMSDVLGVNLEDYRHNSQEYIGSERGTLARVFNIDPVLTHCELTEQTLNTLAQTSIRHANLSQRYFVDMHRALHEVSRVLKLGRHAIIVVCPSHIRQINVPTHEILAEMAGEVNLRLRHQHIRTIDERKRVLPYMQAFGPRMSTEYVLVFKKGS